MLTAEQLETSAQIASHLCQRGPLDEIHAVVGQVSPIAATKVI
jgi:hypothetical protein